MVETVPSEADRTWAAAAHLTILLDIISAPIFGLIGCIVVYVLSRDRGPFARDQAREALNFQLTLALVLAALVAAMLVQLFNSAFGMMRMNASIVIYVALMICAVLAAMVSGVIAALRAKAGRPFSYRVAIRFLR